MSTILSSISGATLTGSSTSDLIIALGNGDLILSGDGNDTVLAYGSNDLIWGGAGNDLITSWGNNNYLMGGAGNDTILAYGRMTSIYTGTGENTVTAGNDSIKVIGSTGMDYVTVLGNNNLVEAGTGGSLVVVDGSNNKVLYNAHLNADHASFYAADKKAGNVLIISVDKSFVATPMITKLLADFNRLEVQQNKLFDFSSYSLDAAGKALLKVQGFASLLINTNPDAISETLAVVLNPLSTSTPITQNALINEAPLALNAGKTLSISDVQSLMVEGKDASKVVVTESASWDIAGGIVKQFDLTTSLGTAIFKVHKDGLETLLDNHAFDKMAIDLKVIYQISDGRGGHDTATSTFNLTSTIPVPPVSSYLEGGGSIVDLYPTTSIDITNLFSGFTTPVTYKIVENGQVISNASVINSGGHLTLNVPSDMLLADLAAGSHAGVAKIEIMATDTTDPTHVLTGEVSYVVADKSVLSSFNADLSVFNHRFANTVSLDANGLVAWRCCQRVFSLGGRRGREVGKCLKLLE